MSGLHRVQEAVELADARDGWHCFPFGAVRHVPGSRLGPLGSPDASDGSCSESDSGTFFHVGARPEDRASMATMRDFSQAYPGRLYEQAMAGVASRL